MVLSILADVTSVEHTVVFIFYLLIVMIALHIIK